MEKIEAVIKKVGNKFCVFSKAGKRLSCHATREAAQKRLRQIEFFKNRGGTISQASAFIKVNGSDFEPNDFDSLDAKRHPEDTGREDNDFKKKKKKDTDAAKHPNKKKKKKK